MKRLGQQTEHRATFSSSYQKKKKKERYILMSGTPAVQPRATSAVKHAYDEILFL